MFMRVEVTLDTKSLEAALGRMRGPEMGRLQLRALEIRANDARKETVQGFMSRGIGRALYGGRGRYSLNEKGAYGLISLSRPKIEGATAYVKLTLKGFAALQELGGRTRPHVITPKSAKVLAFGVRGGFGFGGDLVFAKVVNHPGGTMPRHEALRPAAERAFAAVIADIQRDVVALWDGRAAA